MWLLYLTGLYRQTLEHPVLHEAVHAHMLVSGCLFTFAVIGADPIPGRGGDRVQVATVLCALAAHDILAKYLYIHAADLAAAVPGTDTSSVSWRLGAQLMWYGGETLDITVAVIFFARWYTRRGRELARSRRRIQASVAQKSR